MLIYGNERDIIAVKRPPARISTRSKFPRILDLPLWENKRKLHWAR